MKDRHFCLVLLVGQAHWEPPLGKDDDVADHPLREPKSRVPNHERDHGINPSLSKRLQRERQRSKGLLEALSLAGRMQTALNCAPNRLGDQGSARPPAERRRFAR